MIEDPILPPAVSVRDARPDDHAVILDFNQRLALETEGKKLDPVVLGQGVAAALGDAGRLRYWVAEAARGGRVVGQAAITREWSDWRNGWVWWFQSVYVHPDFRGRGVFRGLHRHVRALALQTPDVIGLRLYVEQENHPALATYEALGFRPGGYVVLEEIWTARVPS